MFTIVETPTFVAEARRYWSDDDRLAFCTWIAANPDAGDVIPGSGGCRKVRWSRPGSGKRGGVWVVYFIVSQAGEIWLLVIYAKSVVGNIPARVLRAIKEEIENE